MIVGAARYGLPSCLVHLSGVEGRSVRLAREVLIESPEDPHETEQFQVRPLPGQAHALYAKFKPISCIKLECWCSVHSPSERRCASARVTPGSSWRKISSSDRRKIIRPWSFRNGNCCRATRHRTAFSEQPRSAAAVSIKSAETEEFSRRGGLLMTISLGAIQYGHEVFRNVWPKGQASA